MDIQELACKFSVFGNYESIDGNSENINRLFERFKEDFLPTMVPMFKFDPMEKKVMQSMRMQLIKQDNSCIITVLPDRVDVEFKNECDRQLAQGYIDRVIEIFNLGINRIALVGTIKLSNIDEKIFKDLNAILGGPQNFDKESIVYEFGNHRVTREYIEKIQEYINVVRNISYIKSPNNDENNFDLNFEYDLNTIGDVKKERFDIKACNDFFDRTQELKVALLKQIEGVINAKEDLHS